MKLIILLSLNLALLGCASGMSDGKPNVIETAIEMKGGDNPLASVQKTDLEANIRSAYQEMALAWIDQWVESYDLEQKRDDLTRFVLKRANPTEYTSVFLKNEGSEKICPDLNQRCLAFIDNIAVMQTIQALDVYMRKNVFQNSSAVHLFDNTTDFDDEIVISWISTKVDVSTLLTHFDGNIRTKIELKPTDEIYFYNAPEFAWKNLWGRQGYAVFREGELIDDIVTLIN